MFDLENLPRNVRAVCSMYRKMPPEALVVMAHANALRDAHRQGKPILKEANVPPKRTTAEPSLSATVAPSPRQPSRRSDNEVSRRIALKAFRGADGRRRAYAAWMDLRSRMGRYNSQPDAVAEVWMRDHGYDVRKIFATATESNNPQSGGYLVDSPLHDEIIEYRNRIGVSRQVAFVLPMKGESVSISTVEADGGFEVYYPNEANPITPSDMSFGQVTLKVKKRAILSYISQEALDDAVIAFLDLFVRTAAYGLAKREDEEYILGNGASSYGMVNGLIGAMGAGSVVTAAATHNSFEELTVADYAAAMATLPSWAADGREVWIASPAAYALGMLQSVGGAAQGFDDEGRPLFLGRPVHLTAAMSSTSGASTIAALYGNFEVSSVIGVRQPVTVAMSSHAGFENDTVAFRAITRYDIAVTAPGDATNAGGYVGLKTAA